MHKPGAAQSAPVARYDEVCKSVKMPCFRNMGIVRLPEETQKVCVPVRVSATSFLRVLAGQQRSAPVSYGLNLQAGQGLRPTYTDS